MRAARISLGGAGRPGGAALGAGSGVCPGRRLHPCTNPRAPARTPSCPHNPTQEACLPLTASHEVLSAPPVPPHRDRPACASPAELRKDRGERAPGGVTPGDELNYYAAKERGTDPAAPAAAAAAAPAAVPAAGGGGAGAGRRAAPAAKGGGGGWVDDLDAGGRAAGGHLTLVALPGGQWVLAQVPRTPDGTQQGERMMQRACLDLCRPAAIVSGGGQGGAHGEHFGGEPARGGAQEPAILASGQGGAAVAWSGRSTAAQGLRRPAAAQGLRRPAAAMAGCVRRMRRRSSPCIEPR